jgi:ABC-type uncharacterized transport system fused permease/ATPase subunit
MDSKNRRGLWSRRDFSTRLGWGGMDEATSALDEANQARVYKLVQEKLPQTTIVSIGHQSALAKFHRRIFYWPEQTEAAKHPFLFAHS